MLAAVEQLVPNGWFLVRSAIGSLEAGAGLITRSGPASGPHPSR